ncbi:uncharacterized protein LOC123012059 [Tribolium madens]|uniref:uncharacterized protein LOC123012059 n=1 Tax=Tribolium madens TaxID=41895 RepID=UPI001CF759CC|nr:uncharacterized protein LOC123012059 [Tribolium madens]
MSLFSPRWLRNFIRRHTNQIPEDRAFVWKQRLSLFYMFVSWNAFGFVLYQVYKGNSDWARKYKSEEELALTPAQQWARTLGIKEAKVMRVSGLQVTKYEINEAIQE